MARIVAMMVVAALAAMPAAALGATGELTPQPAPSQPLLQNDVREVPPAPAPAAPASSAERTIGPGELALVALAIVVLLGGIWIGISRDARRATRGRTQAAAGGLGGGGSATRAAHRSRRLSASERRRRKRGRAR